MVSSDLADGAFRIVMPLLTLTLTRSAIAVSAVGLAVRLPWLIVTLPAGVVADRRPPSRVMRWAAAARLPLTAIAGLLAFARLLSVWELVLVAFAVASAGIAVDVSAQSMLPRMVTGEQLRLCRRARFSLGSWRGRGALRGHRLRSRPDAGRTGTRRGGHE